MSVESDIGTLAAEFLESIAGNYDESASVELAAIVVAVRHGNGQITYHHRFGPQQPSPHAGNGLLEQALDNSRRHFRGEFNRPGGPPPQ
jgi:hypothetical protein